MRLGRNLLVGELRDISARGRVLDGDRADVSRCVEIEQRIFIQIAGFGHGGLAKLNQQRVGAREIANSHGVNRRSKNALCTVSPSARRTTRKKQMPVQRQSRSE